MSEQIIRVTVTADVAPLLKVAEASGTASSATEKMGAVFVTSARASEQLDASLRKVTADTSQAASGIARMGNATAAARVEMGALDGSTGMMLGGLARMAGQSSALAPIISAAFPVFGALAFIDVAESVIERIDKAKDSVAGIGREWMASASASREHSSALELETLKLSDQISMIEGRPKTNMLAIALREADAEAEKLYGTLSADIGKQVELLEKKGVGAFDALVTNTAGTGDLTDKLKPVLAEIQTSLERQKAVYLETSATIASSSDDEAKRRAKAAREAADAEVESVRRSAVEQVAALEQSVTARKAKDIELIQGFKATGEAAAEFGKNTVFATETANRTFAAQESILAGLHTSLIEMGKAQQEIKGIAPLKTQLAGDEGEKDSSERARESAQVKIEAQKKYALAWMDSVEAMAKAELEAGQITATEEIAQRRELEKEKLQIQTDSINAQIALVAKHPSPDKAKDAEKVSGLNTDLETAKAAQVSKMIALDAEFLKAQEASLDAASEAGLKFLDEQQKAAEEKMQAKLRVDERAVASAQTIAGERLAISRNADDEALRAHQISLGTWAEVSIQSVEQWASAQKPVIEKAMKDVQAAIRAETDPKALDLLKERYQALVEKLAQLDQKRLGDVQKINLHVEQSYMQMFQKLQTTVNSTFAALLTGQETWGEASKKIFVSVADSFISNSAKMVEQEATAALTHKSLLKTEILGDAKAAAAGAYKAMASIPIIGPELGAVAAAATFAGVMAFGSFEKGGVARETGIYNLHEGEGVMTRRQTEAINRAGDVTNNGGARHFHTTVNIHHNGTNLSDDDITKSVTSAVRRGTLRVR